MITRLDSSTFFQAVAAQRFQNARLIWGYSRCVTHRSCQPPKILNYLIKVNKDTIHSKLQLGAQGSEQQVWEIQGIRPQVCEIRSIWNHDARKPQERERKRREKKIAIDVLTDNWRQGQDKKKCPFRVICSTGS
jgi:hypothetical protein